MVWVRVFDHHDTWAGGVWQALAATLAEPLEKAMHEHYNSCPVCPVRGIANCDEGYQLWLLLPASHRVVS